MINIRIILVLIICHISVLPVFAEPNLPSYIQKLFDKYKVDYQRIRHSEYNLFVQSFDLDKKNPINQKQFYQIHFIHDLFTGVNATNYSKGGILEIPYFWHWVTPNPRHTITFLPQSTPLSKIKPSKGFLKYKTYADIDRVPSLYLADLVTEKPKYSHSLTGAFYTFGWCSEREMAFNTLLSIMGYESKVKQSGIHTWSEVLTKFVSNKGNYKYIISKVDNTYDTINWKKTPPGFNKMNWLRDFGHGAQVKWYNRKAHSKKQRQKVQNIFVGKNAIKRIDTQVANFVKSR